MVIKVPSHCSRTALSAAAQHRLHSWMFIFSVQFMWRPQQEWVGSGEDNCESEVGRRGESGRITGTSGIACADVWNNVGTMREPHSGGSEYCSRGSWSSWDVLWRITSVRGRNPVLSNSGCWILHILTELTAKLRQQGPVTRIRVAFCPYWSPMLWLLTVCAL